MKVVCLIWLYQWILCKMMPRNLKYCSIACDLFLPLINIAFWKFISTSTICNIGFLLSHMTYTAIFLLKVLFSSGIVDLNLKCGTECSLHISHASYIFSISLLITWFTYFGYAIFSCETIFPDEGCIKW